MKLLNVFFGMVWVVVGYVKMPFFQFFRVEGSFLFAQSRNGRVQRNAVHPGSNFGLPPERMEGAPQLQYNFLEEVVAGIPVGFVQDTNLMDQTLMFVYQVDEGFFLKVSQHRNALRFIGRKLGNIITGMQPVPFSFSSHANQKILYFRSPLNVYNMALRRWIRNFFGFSRAQTHGFIVFLPVVAIVVFSEPLYRWYSSRHEPDFSREQATLDSLAALWKFDEYTVLVDEEERNITLFPFDPNQATEEELRALGFSPGLSKRLIAYRTKGGSFRIKHDLMKLYGMDSLFFANLEPFILLPESFNVAANEKPISSHREKPVTREATRFDLNLADTSLLKTIYGIGSKLSGRIVQHRDRLGGFVATHQLYGIYGLDSAVIDRLLKVSFIREDFQPQTLNINAVTEEELAVHPYISKRMARAMVTYRFQHGKYQSVEDLRKILQLDEAQLNSIRPYLTVD